MRKLCVFLSICVVAFSAVTLVAQTQTPKWQLGTITDVKPHGASQNDTADSNQYEVSVRVGDTVYVALYTPPPGSQTVRYRAGLSLQVLIEKNTLTFNDLLGRANNLPVLRSDVMRERADQ